MIQLTDPIWDTFAGGYRTPYNASTRLQELESGTGNAEEIWGEFWDELHHQGDVDIASYAVVPQMVRISVARNLLDWNVFGLVAVIEECRLFGENPALPVWLEQDYKAAIKQLAEFGARNFSMEWPKELTQTFLAVAAFAKDSSYTGRLLSQFSDDEMKEVYDRFFA